MTLGELPIDVEQGRIDSQNIPWQSSQTLDVKWRARLGGLTNAQNIVCSTNEYVAAMRCDKIVSELVDEDLIARVHRAASDGFAFLEGAAGNDIPIIPQRFPRRIHQ